MLYALGIGVGTDPTSPTDLQFCYEQELKVFPSLVNVIAHPGGWITDPVLEVDWVKLLHGEQSFSIIRPLEAGKTYVGHYRIRDVLDKGEGKGALLFLEKELREKESNEVVSRVTSTYVLRGDGGHGGTITQAPAPHTLPERAADHSLSLPHERALARALGLVKADGSACEDGQIPWAAAASAEPTTPQAWFSPCHFQIGTDHVSLLPGEQIGLTDEDARGLFDAFAPYCAEDGITLRFESATRWHASGEPLRGIACASLDRVSGRPVDGWMPQSPANPAGGQLLKRLQSEAQMLFYTHAVHDEREAARLHPINGFWVSGAGALAQPLTLRPAPAQPDTLRQAALQADWRRWQQAWEALDAGEIAQWLARARRGEAITLTLCGERAAQRFTSAPRTAAGRIGRLFKNILGQNPAWKTLESL